MCLTTDQVICHIARQDIPIIKAVETRGASYVSLNGCMEWTFGKKNKSLMQYTNFKKRGIDEGLHAFLASASLQDVCGRFPSRRIAQKDIVLLDGIIPKGARYFIGSGNEICATRMILQKESDFPYEHGLIERPPVSV